MLKILSTFRVYGDDPVYRNNLNLPSSPYTLKYFQLIFLDSFYLRYMGWIKPNTSPSPKPSHATVPLSLPFGHSVGFFTCQSQSVPLIVSLPVLM